MKRGNQVIIEKKIYKKRNRWKKWKRNKNRTKNRRQKNIRNKIRGRANPYKERNKKIKVPQIFSLISNIEEVLKFINECKVIAKVDARRRVNNLNFDFSNVSEITHGTMALLLSLSHDLGLYGISVRCILPKDPLVKADFEECGIMSFVNSDIPFTKKINDTILVRGLEKIDQVRTAPEVEKAMETVFGVRSRNQKLQGMLVEMMTNSVNHAFIKSKQNTNWYFAIHHSESDKKVTFCFIDNGDGIFNTIHLKFFKKVKIFFDRKSIIKNAFNGEFGSRTMLNERGKGLLMINDCFRHNIISNLKVITNNLFYDFSTECVEELSNNFQGTFYFWELDTKCKNANY